MVTGVYNEFLFVIFNAVERYFFWGRTRMPAAITGVVLTHNEEQNIVDCLAHLRPHVREIILIDTESTDRTVEIAQPLVDKILYHSHVPNFDAARNLAIPAASHDWLWFVDADEHVSEQTGELVAQLVTTQGDTFDALNIPFKSYFCGQWMQHCGWWPGYTMPRVLKRGKFRFAEKLHGGVELDGRELRVAPLPAFGIDHFSYRDIPHYLEKLNRYTSTEASQLASQGRSWDWRAAMRHMLHDLWVYYERNPGHRDGARGWILSWLSGQYRWLSHAKLIVSEGEHPSENNSHAGESFPRDLDEVLSLWEQQLAELRVHVPKLPLGVVWRSPLRDPSGYANESRALIKALAQSQRELRLEPIVWSGECQLAPQEQALFQALERARRPNHSIAISNIIPSLYRPDPAAVLNVLRTTFETDRIPEFWEPALNSADEIWVISQYNRETFIRSGVAPEKIRVVPSCFDPARYRPDGPKIGLPKQLADRFVFLSIFDWGLRKGWDILLRAYCRTFSPQDNVGLFLKFSRNHGHSLEMILRQIDQVLNENGQTLLQRPDIVLSEEGLSEDEVAALYRSVQAFVLPTRGEGWGRPYMEAMASGLPTIGTRASGNLDFMNDGNSLLIDARFCPIPPEGVQEIPVYRDQCWYEPDVEQLAAALWRVATDGELRARVAQQAVREMRHNFDLSAGCRTLEQAIQAAERRLAPVEPPQHYAAQLHVQWEGELFAGHSFARINERMASEFWNDPEIALTLRRVMGQPEIRERSEHVRRVEALAGRTLNTNPDVVVRHAFPPNWNKPEHGKWVHIQPWEFGRLPRTWLRPLVEDVDEIWVPSNYVRDVYLQSGVPQEKIQLVPWGIDPQVFHTNVTARHLPAREFRFLFVGGVIHRKGFDLLLQAYLEEFTAEEAVALVVKDLGAETYYRNSPEREALNAARQLPNAPQLLYLNQFYTDGQLASLYKACDCFVAPYRGEGFCLPVLEAMACGVAAIVPRGGPTDDFVSEATGYLLPARAVTRPDDGQHCGPRSELEIDVKDLRAALRHVYNHRDEFQTKGREAAAQVARDWTWKKTATRIHERLCCLAAAKDLATITDQTKQNIPVSATKVQAVIQASHSAAAEVADSLARIAPFVQRTIVLRDTEDDLCRQIAAEYSAEFWSRSKLPVQELLDYVQAAEWVVVLQAGAALRPETLDDALKNLSQSSSNIQSIQLPVRGETNSAQPVAALWRASALHDLLLAQGLKL
jgi:glycosyltransferase involved in cell wall biosynthesis